MNKKQKVAQKIYRARVKVWWHLAANLDTYPGGIAAWDKRDSKLCDVCLGLFGGNKPVHFWT